MRIFLTALFFAALWAGPAARLAGATRFYGRVDWIPRGLTDGPEARSLREAGASEADVLSHFLRRNFYRLPEWSAEEPQYRPGVVRVTESETGSDILIEEPVTGFSVRLEFSVKDGARRIVRKTVKRLTETVDTVDYEYRGNKLVSARSRIYGRARIAEQDGDRK